MALTCRVEEPSTASLADIRAAYSITSSARAISVGEVGKGAIKLGDLAQVDRCGFNPEWRPGGLDPRGTGAF